MAAVDLMILGEPNLKSIIELIEAERCPECGEPTIARSINGPDEIVLDCGDVVDAVPWIDSDYYTKNEEG